MIDTIGIIGAGLVGQALAGHAARSGHRVLLSNSRGPESLGDMAESLGVTASTVEDAAEADLVVLAVPFVSVPALAASIPNWNDKTVLDTTNQFATANPYGGRADIGDLTGSEWVAQQLPGAKIVKAFGALYGKYISGDPRHEEGNQVVFFAGDDTWAKTDVANLLEEFGFASIDIGNLRDGGRLIQLDGALSRQYLLSMNDSTRSA